MSRSAHELSKLLSRPTPTDSSLLYPRAMTLCELRAFAFPSMNLLLTLLRRIGERGMLLS